MARAATDRREANAATGAEPLVSSTFGFSRDASGAALLGGVSLSKLVRDGAVATPSYVYDLDAVRDAARRLRAGFGSQRHLVCYAVKANSAGPILRALRGEGCGADVVSGAELALALECGIGPEEVVYSGVAKRDDEIDVALRSGDRGILAIQIESIEEIPRVEARAKRLGKRARVSVRINPGVEADTHAHIATGHDEAKFGVPKADLEHAIDALHNAPNVDLVGISSHVGSQLTAVTDYVAAAKVVLQLATVVETALARTLEFLDFGGGFGIDYGAGCPVSPADFAARLVELVANAHRQDTRVLCEPGRALVAPFGVLVATTIMEKRARPTGAMREWLMIDAGMNDLLRPALYGARHRIEPLDALPPASGQGRAMRVVGPVCESSDDFGEHTMPLEPVSHVVIRDAGAYGFTMASEYNGRALPTEIFLEGGNVAARIEPRRAAAWIKERAAL